VPHQPPAPKCQTHKLYLLSCADYDELVERASGRCEICQIRGEDTAHGMLHIDHDPARGIGAVRGLLCSPCNTNLGRSFVPRNLAAAYLARPLFRHRMPTGYELAVGTSKQIRMPDDEWLAFRRAAKTQGTRHVHVLRQFVRWYIGAPGCSLPERPSDQ
jgi:hypothetical protein